jgi:hypothetical protein
VVRGKLVARGTDENPIVFTSASTTPNKGDWGNVDFRETASNATFHSNGTYDDGSILEHVIIEYAGRTGATTVAGVHFHTSLPYLNYVTVQNCLGNSIHVIAQPSGTLRLDYVRLFNGGSYGILVNNPFYHVKFFGGSIENHTDRGINIPTHSTSTATTITVENALIFNNNQYGIYMNNAGRLNVINCNITKHNSHAILYENQAYYTPVNIYDTYISQNTNTQWAVEIRYGTVDMRNTTLTDNSKDPNNF